MFFFSSALKRCCRRATWKLILQPQALIGVRHVRKLRTDGVGVDELQVRENVLQLGALRNRLIAAAGEEFGVEVGIGQAEVLQIEHIGLGAVLQTERIQAGDQMTAVRIDLDEARHGALLGAGSSRGAAGQAPPRAGGNWRLASQALANRAMGDFARPRPSVTEVRRPRRIDRTRGPRRNCS